MVYQEGQIVVKRNIYRFILAFLIIVIALVITAMTSHAFNILDFVVSLGIAFWVYGQAGKLDSGSSNAGMQT